MLEKGLLGSIPKENSILEESSELPNILEKSLCFKRRIQVCNKTRIAEKKSKFYSLMWITRGEYRNGYKKT
jgi:hypothetical protein